MSLKYEPSSEPQVSSVDYTGDVRVGGSIMKQVPPSPPPTSAFRRFDRLFASWHPGILVQIRQNWSETVSAVVYSEDVRVGGCIMKQVPPSPHSLSQSQASTRECSAQSNAPTGPNPLYHRDD